MKKFAMILAALLAAVMTLSACALTPAQTATPEPTAEVTAAPEASTGDDAALEFSVTTLTGDTLDQSVFSDNKLIMVNYWATWCGPCVGEIPDLIKISKDYADKGFVIIGVLTG
ncbi:MAG: TlpA disulfide reductase family protein [Eubacteriales bacterium]